MSCAELGLLCSRVSAREALPTSRPQQWVNNPPAPSPGWESRRNDSEFFTCCIAIHCKAAFESPELYRAQSWDRGGVSTVSRRVGVFTMFRARAVVFAQVSDHQCSLASFDVAHNCWSHGFTLAFKQAVAAVFKRAQRFRRCGVPPSSHC